MHRSIASSLRRTHPLPKAKPAMVRVSVDGVTCALSEREEVVAHNRDTLTDQQIADIRAGRAVTLGGGAAPRVTIEPAP